MGVFRPTARPAVVRRIINWLRKKCARRGGLCPYKHTAIECGHFERRILSDGFGMLL